MSLETNIRNSLTRIATEFKNLNIKIAGTSSGDLTALQTTAKGNLVAAINELKSALASAGLNEAQVDARIANWVGAAPASLDTLTELASALGNDANFASTINNAIAARLRFDAAQTLTAPQKTQALANLGAAPTVHSHNDLYFTKAEIGDVTSNLVTHFESGLV